MNREKAWEAIFLGGKVRLNSWGKGEYLYWDDEEFCIRTQDEHLVSLPRHSPENYWELYEEPQPEPVDVIVDVGKRYDFIAVWCKKCKDDHDVRFVDMRKEDPWVKLYCPNNRNCYLATLQEVDDGK